MATVIIHCLFYCTELVDMTESETRYEPFTRTFSVLKTYIIIIYYSGTLELCVMELVFIPVFRSVLVLAPKTLNVYEQYPTACGLTILH